MRIVVAEDLYLLRDGMIRLLKAYGHEVVATARPETLDALLTWRPDVSIVDVRMPPTQSDEGLRAALAARRELPGLPVLILSQHVEQLYARELLAASAISSKRACSTPISSSMPWNASPMAGPPWTRPSSRPCCPHLPEQDLMYRLQIIDATPGAAPAWAGTPARGRARTGCPTMRETAHDRDRRKAREALPKLTFERLRRG